MHQLETVEVPTVGQPTWHVGHKALLLMAVKDIVHVPMGVTESALLW